MHRLDYLSSDIYYPKDNRKKDLTRFYTYDKSKSNLKRNNEMKYVVRLYDGFDNLWMDICEPTTKERAEEILARKTNNGKKNAKFEDIDYYEIFPADTKMLFSVG